VDVAVIGLGLIGGSLTRALAARGHHVLGYDLDPATRGMARTAAAQAPAGERFQVAGNIREAVNGCSLSVVAVPLPAVAAVLDELANCGFTGLITDVTSVKVPVRRLAEDRLRDRGQRLAGFIGGHPMAGKEHAGFGATDPQLFQGCAWALCLEPETSLSDWLALASLIISLGARVVPTTAAVHDEAVAAVSHLPHLVAAALATAANDPLAATLAAGSFRDATRVAATPAHLIGAMCGGNAEPLARVLDDLLDSLTDARNALDGRHPVPAVTSWAQPGHQARVRWPHGWGEPFVVEATVGGLLDLGADGGWITQIHADGRRVTATRPL
jgi:prephenate dehydrogenase